MGVGGALTSWHADDRSAAGTRRRPQSRAAGPRRPRRGPSGLGADLRRSLSPVRLRLAGGTEHAAWQGLFEIVALTGTLSQDRGHLHLAVADHQGRTRGGTSPRAAPCAPLVALAADDRLVFAASTILPPATTSWWSASVTPEARDRHRGPGSPGPFDPGKITAPKPLGGHRTAGRRWARLRRSPAGPGCAAPPPELPGAGPPPAPAALTRIPVPSSRSPGGMVQPGPAGNLVLVGAGGIAFGHRRPAIPRPADNQSPAWLAASPVAVSTSGWRGIGIGRRPRGCRGSCGVL
jgi:hypothetical protein